MKKIIITIFIAATLLLTGCNSKETPVSSSLNTSPSLTEGSDAVPSKDTSSDAPSNMSSDTSSEASSGSNSETQSDTTTDNSTSEPSVSSTEGNKTNSDETSISPENTETELTDEEIYSRFIGTWYFCSSEVDGCQDTATQNGCTDTLTFSEDRQLTKVLSYVYEDTKTEIKYDNLKCGSSIYGYSDATVSATYALSDSEEFVFEYFFTDNGNLVEYCVEYYDEVIPVGIWREFTTEPVDFFGTEYVDYLDLEVPAAITQIIENAAENARIAILTGVDSELWEECINLGWRVSDESDNEWVPKFINPQNTIVINCSNTTVEIEVHEPESSYDTTSSANEWVPGPFMYYKNLKPGQIFCFIGDVADTPVNARQAVYMNFEDNQETDYYIRLYTLSFDAPYIIF